MINEVLDQLVYLKLKSAYTYLKELHINDQVTNNDLKGIHKILNREVIAKEENNKLYNVKVAGFPFLRKIEEYDFDFQPTVNEEKIKTIANSNFYEEAINVVFVGNPGVGKTHTAIGLGIAANMKSKNVLYVTVPNLITELKESMTLNQLTNYKKRFISYDLVILDELGYIGFDKEGSELLFNLLSMRNETKSIIITTNLTFNRWEEIFGDPTLTAAMVDRLAHKATVINIKGDSYRIKETKDWLSN